MLHIGDILYFIIVLCDNHTIVVVVVCSLDISVTQN